MKIFKPYYQAVLSGLFFLLLPGVITFAQIASEPALPTAEDQVVITFDATKGGRGLAGYNGPVFAHTGVFIEGETGWRHVIGGWGDNAVQPQLSRIGPDLYRLVIGPDIRQYYGVAAGKNITSMNFVFRGSSGSPQTEDFFVEVVEPGLRVSVLSPAGPQPVFSLFDTVLVRAAANEADSLELYINNEWFATAYDEEELRYDWYADAYGRFDIELIAYAEDETALTAAYFYIRPPVPVADLPEGVISGINYMDDQTVTLVLHDPPALKEYAFVIADFNDWGVGEDSYMNRTPDGTYFWVTVSGLEPGKEYGFQYFVDGVLRMADPYAEKILDPWHDNEIREQGRYPGLIPYPAGKTDHAVSVLQTAREPYQWQNNNFTAPAVEDLVVYEVLIRDFLSMGTYENLRDTLAYLKRLGVNAIELMPVTQFEGNLSWGYNPAFYFAADKYYGPRRELKKFIDAAHGMGMAVIIDMVWNHSFGQSPLLRMYFNESNNRPSADNPWYSNPIFANPAMNFGYKFDHGSPYFIEFMDRANRYWMEEYRVDGFRFDLTKGFTTRFKGSNDEWGSLYDQERINNLVRMYNQIKGVNPDAYVILEHLADNAEETVLANNGMLLWGNLSHSYQEAAMGWLAQSNFNWISWQRRNWNDPNLIGYMESHDEERIVFKNLTYGNSNNPAHDVKELNTALKRMELAAAFFFPIPGPKMIWQFGELGYDYSINHCPNGSIDDGCRTSPKPVRWDYYLDPARKRVYDIYAALIHLKTTEDVFRTDEYTLSLSGAMKSIRLYHPDQQVVVLGNFGVEGADMNPQFPQTGKWYEFFTRTELQVTDTERPLFFRPGEYRMYSTVPFPDHGIDIPVYPNMGEALVYPNPSPAHFNLAAYLPVEGKVTLEVFDQRGQLIHKQQGTAGPGDVRLYWDGNMHGGERARQGLYIYRLRTPSDTFSGKIMVQ
jgi:1,4-alpha-glucan branching enzyme